MRRKILIAVVALVVALVGASLVGGWVLVDYALDNSDRPRNVGGDRFAMVKKNHPETSLWIDSLQSRAALRDTFIVMPGGYRGHALYVRNPKAHGHTAILVHGYKDSAAGMLHIARIYNEILGWNIVVPDLYAHGWSEGDDVRMGWLDRRDVIEWAVRMEQVFSSPGDSTVMALHGVSMGGATVMYCSGDRLLPKFVKGIVEDCGYSSVWTELRLELKKRFGLPALPLLYSASFVNKMRHSWRLGEASAVRSVARSTVPMLFIHGSADTFVPTWMVLPCYEAKQTGAKMLWIAPGSEHAEAYSDHKGEYVSRVVTFASSL